MRVKFYKIIDFPIVRMPLFRLLHLSPWTLLLLKVAAILTAHWSNEEEWNKSHNAYTFYYYTRFFNCSVTRYKKMFILSSLVSTFIHCFELVDVKYTKVNLAFLFQKVNSTTFYPHQNKRQFFVSLLFSFPILTNFVIFVTLSRFTFTLVMLLIIIFGNVTV